MIYDKELFSINLSKKERDNEDRLIKITDKLITGLVVKKNDVELAYNYYNCIISKDRFRYLEDMYGISNPTSLEFVPLVRRHIDFLVGELLVENINPKVTCKDFKSLTLMKNEKENMLKDVEISVLKERFKNNVKSVFTGGQPQEDDPYDEIKGKQEKINQEFVSKFEIAVQYIIRNIIQSKHVDFQTKLKMLFKDYMVAGQCFYKINMVRKGDMPVITVFHPANVFYEKNHNSPYIKDSSKAVAVRYMNYQQIIDEFGSKLNDDDIEKILSEFPYDNAKTNDNVYYMRTPDSTIAVPTIAPSMNIASGFFNADPTTGYDYAMTNVIPVYDVEWIETFKEGNKIKTERYVTNRIGSCVYVLTGEDDDIVYSKFKKDRATLSINGICNIDRSGRPFSLINATSNLQD